MKPSQQVSTTVSLNRQLEEIFYLDEAGITRLYNQIKDRQAESFTKEIGSTSELSGALKPEIDTGIIWTKLLAGLKIASEIAHKRSKAVKTVETHTMSIEQRYLYLLTYISKSGKLRRGLHDGWLNALAKGESSFCLFEAEFHPEAVPSNDWVLAANERKTLIITDVNRQYRMGMGLNNLVDAYNDTIGQSSHIAVRLRGGAKIRALGKIDKSKYIKPFIVSWM